MEEIGLYLLKSSLSMALLYSVYWFFLRNETSFRVNRYYLVSALLLSLILPLISIHYTVLAPESMSMGSLNNSILKSNEAGNNSLFSGIIRIGLVYIYLPGAVIFLFRILWQAVILFRLIRKNGIKFYNETRVVENTRFTLPFSFLNLIFINPQHIRKSELDQIIAHEKVHIRENHWLDLLLVEFTSILFWFNPFIWFMERSIKQNHEYLADEGVIAQGNGVGRYHMVLINQLMGMEVIGITNNLNYSLNAKRLKMMKKKKTPKARALNCLWALPVVALLLAAFAQPEYERNDIYNGSNEIYENVKLSCAVFDTNGDPIPGATAIIKGKKTGATTGSDGVFTIELSTSDIVIISFKGFKDQVIAMEKLVEKNGKSDLYKVKVKMSKEGEEKTLKPNGGGTELEELEMKLKELSLKREKLLQVKEKIAQMEKEGNTDQKKLDEKKAALKEDFMANEEQIKKVKTKLKAMQK